MGKIRPCKRLAHPAAFCSLLVISRLNDLSQPTALNALRELGSQCVKSSSLSFFVSFVRVLRVSVTVTVAVGVAGCWWWRADELETALCPILTDPGISPYTCLHCFVLESEWLTDPVYVLHYVQPQRGSQKGP
ncbi:hypothetical protein LY78DRAFT_736344 [Colletotrichum sublineola]|nr:hypothetical protein LY78DRAFT_736344 [Colletotrichum sublineola]